MLKYVVVWGSDSEEGFEQGVIVSQLFSNKSLLIGTSFYTTPGGSRRSWNLIRVEMPALWVAHQQLWF